MADVSVRWECWISEDDVRGLVATARAYGIPAMRLDGYHKGADKVEAIVERWDAPRAAPEGTGGNEP
jgi:hypothetical protein